MTQDNFDLLLTDIDDFIEFTDITIQTVTLVISDDAADIIDEIEDVISDELEKLFQELDALTDLQIEFSDQILLALDFQQRDTLKELEDVQEKLLDEITNLEIDIENEIRDSREKITLAIIEGEIGLGLAVREAEEAVRAEFDVLLEEIEEENRDTRNKITGFVGDRLDEVDNVLQAVGEKVTDVSSELAETVGDVLEDIPDLFGTALSKVFDVVFKPLKTFFDFFAQANIQQAIDENDVIFRDLEEDDDIGPFISDMTKTGSPQLIAGVVGIVIGVLITGPMSVANAWYKGIADKANQLSMRKWRPFIWSLADLRELTHRGQISVDRANDNMERIGLSDEAMVEARALLPNLLGIGEVISLWRRKEITDEDAQRRIHKLGFSETDTAHIQTLGFGLPPIQDMITMAVREAFQLDVAERFGQLFGLPDDIRQAFVENLAGFGAGAEGSVGAFAEFAGQQGLKPEWIAAYWAAHWREPGVNQLYNMVHRLAPDIIADKRADFEEFGLDPDQLSFTLDDLTLGLQKQDLTPFWWQRLTAIAFSPLTRVDVRRMHSLGLLTRDEVKKRYRELGFSPADAELMTQFTEAFNEQPEETEDIETRDLTRAQVLSFFEDGLLLRDEAKEALINIGFSIDTAETIIIDRELSAAKRETDLAVRTIEIRFDNGLIDFNVASNDLDALLLPAVKRDNILARLEAEIAGRVRLPTLANLNAFLKRQIITSDEYREELTRIGYPDIWADRFAALRGIVDTEDEN